MVILTIYNFPLFQHKITRQFRLQVWELELLTFTLRNQNFNHCTTTFTKIQTLYYSFKLDQFQLGYLLPCHDIFSGKRELCVQNSHFWTGVGTSHWGAKDTIFHCPSQECQFWCWVFEEFCYCCFKELVLLHN
jgi:hypothetical protein